MHFVDLDSSFVNCQGSLWMFVLANKNSRCIFRGRFRQETKKEKKPSILKINFDAKQTEKMQSHDGINIHTKK